MEIVYEDEYVQMTYDTDCDLIIDVWTAKSEDLTEEGFKKIMFSWLDLIQQNQISYALTDTLNFRVTLSPELQNWIVENIAKEARKYGYHKQAFIMPEDFFANISIELLTDEQVGVTTSKYFSNMTSARKWLLN